MNWSRGFFRFWLVVSIFWGLVVGWFAYASFQTIVGLARQFGVTGADWLVLLLVLLLPIGVTLVLCLIFVWIVRGFRP